MSRQFLLDCPSCGKQHVVDTSQSGLKLDCACGHSVLVPTLRDLARLPAAETAVPAVPGSSWGPRQRVALVGVLTAVLGFAGCWYLATTLPEMPTVAFTSAAKPNDVSSFTLRESIEYWNYVRTGIVHPAPVNQLARWQTAVDVQRRLIWVSGIVGVLGLLVAIAAPLGLLFDDTPPESADEAHDATAERTLPAAGATLVERPQS